MSRNSQLPLTQSLNQRSLPGWEWMNDWQTYAANDNWNCLWLPTWFQFRGKGKTTDKRTVAIFASLLMRFSWKRPGGRGPPKKKKTQQFPGLMGLRAAWERSLETTSQRQQAEATLNRFRVVVWHLTDKLPQFADDDDDDDEGEGASRWKRSTILCLSPLRVHVAALSFQTPSLYRCSAVTPSGIHSLWQMCVDCWLKLPNWQTAEKRRQRLENRKKASKKKMVTILTSGRERERGGGKLYPGKATNLGFNK